MIPVKILIRVDLPQPLGPIKTVVLLFSISRLTCFSASADSKDLEILLIKTDIRLNFVHLKIRLFGNKYSIVPWLKFQPFLRSDLSFFT